MHKIPARATTRVLDSVAFLNEQYGMAFNGMLTLNFREFGASTEREACRVLTEMNEAMAEKLARERQRHGSEAPYVYMYVHEDVPTSYGHHVHQLVSLTRWPGEFFQSWLQEWAQRNYGCGNDRAIQYNGRYPKSLADRVDQQSRLVRYVLKSSENAGIQGREGATTLHAILEVERHKRYACANVSKVVGTSQNLAISAQDRMGFSVPVHWETVFTAEALEAFSTRQRATELHRQLAAIEV